ncbi:hypothetical protein GCM10018780_86080 [Streptomyces lanatus]|nr:hypothetical protein GCM10018780_86080 [Streptomyces lanatus]
MPTSLKIPACGGAEGFAETCRRMAHGNICAPEDIDAALASYFRPGHLTALRQLPLLWVADRVDEALNSYRAEHAIGGVWEARERVVVALTGGPEGDTINRRAARIAARSAGGDLLAAHVTRSDGLGAGASYAEILHEPALPPGRRRGRRDHARGVRPCRERHPARAGRHSARAAGGFVTGPGTGESLVALSGDIDVHRVTRQRAGRGTLLPSRRRTLSRSRSSPDRSPDSCCRCCSPSDSRSCAAP